MRLLFSQMVNFDRKAKMDRMVTLDYLGWQFLCSSHQLQSGLFYASVRYRASRSDLVRTLLLDFARYDLESQALEHAKEIAIKWANKQRHGNFGVT